MPVKSDLPFTILQIHQNHHRLKRNQRRSSAASVTGKLTLAGFSHILFYNIGEPSKMIKPGSSIQIYHNCHPLEINQQWSSCIRSWKIHSFGKLPYYKSWIWKIWFTLFPETLTSQTWASINNQPVFVDATATNFF